MGRMRVYDAKELAQNTAQRFNDRPWEYKQNLPFSWPKNLRNVGDSLAVAYASDKWKPKKNSGSREVELYKHLAESRNRAFVKPGLLYDYHSPSKSWPVIGPTMSFEDCPMPKHFAILGLFEEVDLQLYTAGSNADPEFSDDEDEGIVKITVRHGMLGGGYFMWSAIDEGDDEPFLFVYTKTSGVCMILTGEDLDIQKDGIVG